VESSRVERAPLATNTSRTKLDESNRREERPSMPKHRSAVARTRDLGCHDVAASEKRSGQNLSAACFLAMAPLLSTHSHIKHAFSVISVFCRAVAVTGSW
jgi:hypothetical protein